MACAVGPWRVRFLCLVLHAWHMRPVGGGKCACDLDSTGALPCCRRSSGGLHRAEAEPRAALREMKVVKHRSNSLPLSPLSPLSPLVHISRSIIFKSETNWLRRPSGDLHPVRSEAESGRQYFSFFIFMFCLPPFALRLPI